MAEEDKSDKDKLEEWFRIHPNPEWMPLKPSDSQLMNKLNEWFKTQPNPDVAPPGKEEDEDNL